MNTTSKEVQTLLAALNEDRQLAQAFLNAYYSEGEHRENSVNARIDDIRRIAYRQLPVTVST